MTNFVSRANNENHLKISQSVVLLNRSVKFNICVCDSVTEHTRIILSTLRRVIWGDGVYSIGGSHWLTRSRWRGGQGAAHQDEEQGDRNMLAWASAPSLDEEGEALHDTA